MAGTADAVIFEVPGEARAWARARVRVVEGKDGRAFPQHFMDSKTRSYEGAVKLAASIAMRNREIFDCPVTAGILIRKLPPKSASKKLQAAMLAGQVRPGTKPDCSNIAKGIEDALNGIVYRDDSLIVDLRVSKTYAAKAGVDVVIRRWVPPEEPK